MKLSIDMCTITSSSGWRWYCQWPRHQLLMQYLSTIEQQLLRIHAPVGAKNGNGNRYRMEWHTLLSLFEDSVIEPACLRRVVQAPHEMKNRGVLQYYTLQGQ